MRFFIETESGNPIAAAEAKRKAVDGYLAYRLDGGENHNPDGRRHSRDDRDRGPRCERFTAEDAEERERNEGRGFPSATLCALCIDEHAGRRFSVQVDAKPEAGAPPSEVESARECATLLLGLPWELLHNGDAFLFQGAKPVRVRRRLPNTRVLDVPVVATPIRILLVTARPGDEACGYIDHRASALPLVEAMEALGGLVRIRVLDPPTLPALREELDQVDDVIRLPRTTGAATVTASGQTGVLTRLSPTPRVARRHVLGPKVECKASQLATRNSPRLTLAENPRRAAARLAPRTTRACVQPCGLQRCRPCRPSR